MLVACNLNSKKQLEADEYIQEIKTGQTNVIKKSMGDINYSLIYKPADYVMLSENKDVVKSNIEELKKEYGKLEYYTLELTINNFNDEILKYKVQSPEEYNAKVDYYSFKFQNDICEIIDRDTLRCVSYHFERNYGISPKIRFNIAFQSSLSDNDRTVSINDKYLGTGPVKITFSKKELNNLPELTF